MADAFVLARSIEDVFAALDLLGDETRETLETYQVRFAFIDAATVAPDRPIQPDVSTTWVDGEWDQTAPQLTAVIRVNDAPPSPDIEANKTYYVFVRVTGGDQDVIVEAGTVFGGPNAAYGGDPANSAQDATRFLIGDTTSPFVLSDAEISWSLAMTGDPTDPVAPIRAAISLCYTLAARFAQTADQVVTGDESVTWTQRSKRMLDVAERLGALESGATSATAGLPTGLGLADLNQQAKPRAFFVGMHSWPFVPLDLVLDRRTV